MSVHQFGYLGQKHFIYQPMLNFISPGFRSPSPQNHGPIDELVNMYDDRILQLDEIMRKTLEQLGQKGYLKDYLAVFTADHGQLLGDHGKYGHGSFPYLNAIHIPVIFFGSNPIPPFPQSHFCVQIDIAPSLSDLAGLPTPPVWQGQSLLGGPGQSLELPFQLVSPAGSRGGGGV